LVYKVFYTVAIIDNFRNGFKMEIGLSKEGFESCARTFLMCPASIVAGSPVDLGSRGIQIDTQTKPPHIRPSADIVYADCTMF
jgi:hypothetical protein